MSVRISSVRFNSLAEDELEEIHDSSSEYVFTVSVLVGILSKSIDIKSLMSWDGSQIVPVEVHKEKIQLLLIEVLIVLEVGFLL